MKHTIKNVSCIALSVTLFLSSAACAKQPASQKPQDSSPVDESASVSEAAPQESAIKYQTYQIPNFGIKFDCPADFVSSVESNAISENEVFFTVNGAEDDYMLFTCSRIESLEENVPLYNAAGVDSALLYEKYQTLDVDAEIADWRNTGFESFKLLDSFSAPNSYGFYYIGKGDSESHAQLCFKYKNYGDFEDARGIINIGLIIGVSEKTDQGEFIALCEAVTSSLRLSDTGTVDAAPSVSEKPAMEPLKGSTYEEQCAEIVGTLFHYAPLACYDGPRLYLEQLLGGNEALFKSLECKGGLLEGEDNFASELAIQDCGKNGGAANAYYINVNEIRTYHGIGKGEYTHTIYITINSSTDYCVTGVDSVYNGPADNGYEGPASGGAAGSFVSLYNDEDGIYDGPPDGEFYNPDGTFNRDYRTQYRPPEIEAQRTYGTNALIDELEFTRGLMYIKEGDVRWAIAKRYGISQGSTALYQSAYQVLEKRGFAGTPLYELAWYRYQSSLMVWGLN